MRSIQFNLKKILIGLALFVFPLFSINSSSPPEQSSWYLRPFFTVTSFLQDTYSTLSLSAQETTSLYIDLIDVKTDNRRLTSENRKLKAQLTLLQEKEQEIEKLNNLLNLQSQSPMKLLAARVIGRDLISDHSTITIDKGSNHQLQKNQAVITTNGVVGYLFRVSFNTSQVLLITDRYAVIDSMVQKSRAQGFVTGTSKNTCQIQYIEKREDLNEGDLIITSGLNRVFPRGIPIGRVKTISSSNFGTSFTAEVKPIVQPQKLEEVFIIQQLPPETEESHEEQ